MTDRTYTVGAFILFLGGIIGYFAATWYVDRRKTNGANAHHLENPGFIPMDTRTLSPREIRPAVLLPVPTEDADWDEAVVSELSTPKLTPCPICGKEFKRVKQHHAMTHAREMTMKENQSERVHPLPE